MSKRILVGGMSIALVLLASVSGAQERIVLQSARQIPVAYEVDVVVIGGSTGAVAAAVEAAGQGAKVFLAAPQPYLGEDVCGTYRLWLEPGEEPATPLAQSLFEEPLLCTPVRELLPFTYETSLTFDEQHKDTTPPSMLADGKWQNAYNQSVQYNGDVVVTADLGSATAIGKVHILAFQRNADIELQDAAIAISGDGTAWREIGTVVNDKLGQGDFLDSALTLSVPVDATARYVRVTARKTPNVQRLLLAEIAIEPPVDEAALKRGHRLPPAPMQVKRVLDQALLDAGVEFLFGCYPTDVLREPGGELAGIVMANRAGRQAVLAKVVIDATDRGTVARMAGAKFSEYPAGKQPFTRIVVGGEQPAGTPARVELLPSPVQSVQAEGGASPQYDAFAYTLDIDMPDASCASFAAAENTLRDASYAKGQVAASDMPFQVPPDKILGEFSLDSEWPGPGAVDLDVFRPVDIKRLYVLGGCADVPRDAAAKLLRPLAYMDAGTRIGRAAAAGARAKPRPKIVCFGDSITAQHYPGRLETLLGNYDVINAGVGGDTAPRGLARIENDVLAHRPAAVVVMFGTNDSVMPSPGAYKTPLDAYEGALREIVKRCQAAGAQVVVCTLPPIVPEQYHARHPKEYYDPEGGLEAVLTRYRDAAARVAHDTGAALADVNAALVQDAVALFPDGVHPSAEGERRVAALLAETLRNTLGETGPARALAPGAYVPGRPGAPTEPGDVRESLTGVRPFQNGLPTIPAEAAALPVLAEYDVVVIGGGTGGAPAGISAARRGARTLVVEYLHGLGGVSTLGLIGNYYWGHRQGFTAEIDAAMEATGAQRGKSGWYVEGRMEWYRRELRAAGADIWFGCIGCGAVVDGNTVKGAVVATPWGRGVVLADVVIDSTGNADIAVAAGAQSVYTDGSYVAVQGTGMPPRNLGANYTNTDYTITDDGDILDMWQTFVVAKDKYKSAFDLGQLIDTRERRRIVGDFVISPLDLFNGRTYPDSIGYSYSNFDSHGYTVHPLFTLNPPDKTGVGGYTPYRALLPEGYEGMLVTGLGISAHRDAVPILRMQPDIQNQGYAAGAAAAMAAQAGVPLRHIDLKALQHHLVETGCVPENVLTDTDSYPFSEAKVRQAVADVVDDFKGLGVILAQPDEAKPLLRSAYELAANEDDRLVYAHILGMLGDNMGISTLLAAIDSREWDEGWNFKGMGQFGGSVSPLDSLIIAAGATRDKRAVEPILRKLKQLGPDSAFSHHRAAAVALESLKASEAAEAMAALLRMPGMMGHAATDIQDAKTQSQYADPDLSRNLSLRELILARALYRCGDYDGLGERILREYAQDLHGHHARHATAVLNDQAARK
ncbi:MAG TPA: FAD-dependent oxidoreductase [Candidatus Hydrogenedentes bacterium]|nr:FAD-dependent oxidoreductase [Candidatus Hydrogenedentota bacterium]